MGDNPKILLKTVLRKSLKSLSISCPLKVNHVSRIQLNLLNYSIYHAFPYGFRQLYIVPVRNKIVSQ